MAATKLSLPRQLQLDSRTAPEKGLFLSPVSFKCLRTTGDETGAMSELTIPQAAEQGKSLCPDKEEEGEEVRRSIRNFL